MRKKILYIGTPIFGFNKHIIDEFERQGYIVDYYDDRPSDRSITKGLIKLTPNLMQYKIKKYVEYLKDNLKKEQYDLVFVVNGKVFNKEIIQTFRKYQPHAEFVYYTWDSIENYPNSLEVSKEFDRSYTFDLKNAQDIEYLNLLPLFYNNNFKNISHHKENYTYDLISVCTAHPNRYKVIKNIFPTLEKESIQIFSFMYLNRLQYYYNKLFVEEFKKSRSKEFSFNILPEEDYLNYLEKSKVVFDVEHYAQTGLTMRTMETLGAKRKLITTNRTISEYDFYDENNIFILDDKNIGDIFSFIEKPYSEISLDIYEKYSLSNWVRTIINS